MATRGARRGQEGRSASFAHAHHRPRARPDGQQREGHVADRTVRLKAPTELELVRIRGAASLPVRTTRRPCFANVRARTPRLRSSSAARVRHARERHVRRLRVSRASDTSCTSNTGSVRPGRGGGFSAVAAEEADRHEGKCRRIQRADAVCRRCGTRTAAQQKFTRVSFWRKPTRCRLPQARNIAGPGRRLLPAQSSAIDAQTCGGLCS